MEFADEADVAKLLGETENFHRLTEQAFELEKAAADEMKDIHVEPSRGVLHRSAATLAWRCGRYDEAEKLIYRALAGNPRNDIEWELKDLLGTVNLAKAGIRLSQGHAASLTAAAAKSAMEKQPLDDRSDLLARPASQKLLEYFG